MGLEAATYISQLVSTNPTGLDQKKDGDNHIRLMKEVLKNTFPTADRAFFLASWAEKEKDFLEKSADYTMEEADDGKLIHFDCSGGNRIYTLLPVATAGKGLVVFISRDEADANTLTLDADGAETINGATTLVVRKGFLYCGGAGEEWKFFSSEANGELRSRQIFTASGTWNKPVGLKRVRVIVVGAGGSGGGAGLNGGGSVTTIGGGGGSGSYSESILEASALAASVTVTVGAGTIGDTDAGATGGSSSFGAHVTANGGSGGATAGPLAPPLVAQGGLGGAPGTGQFTARGNPGGNSIGLALALCALGAGGAGPWGGGGVGNATTSGDVSGNAGQSYGAGGSGAYNDDNTTASPGGDGFAGVVIVDEYF